MPGGAAHYFVCPLTTADQPKIAAFRTWLIAQAASEQAEAPLP